MLKFLTKNYLWITILLLGIAILLDLNYDTIETIKTPKTILNSDGEQIKVEILTLKNSYQLIRALIYILYSLGVSLIVLVAIDKRIDIEENKKYKDKITNLNQKIQNNIFDGVLNKFVPEKLFDQVKKDIFQNDIIRKNAKWNYQISLNGQDNIVLQQTIKYEIENLTEDKLEKDIPVNINFSNKLGETKITQWKLKKSNGNLENEAIDNFENLKVNLDKRETKIIELNIKNEYTNNCIMDSHMSNFSIIGLEIQIQKPENVEVKVIPSFSTNLAENRPNNTLITFDRIDSILLGQGISFIIEKKITLPNTQYKKLGGKW